MSWFSYTFYSEKDIYLRLTFVQKIRRVDIRIHDYGYATKDGVSLTASELRFVNSYIMNYFDGRPADLYYRVSISKQPDGRFLITKKGKDDAIAGVAISADFWKPVSPMVRGLIYLIQGKDLPMNQLIDLWLMSRKYNKDEMLGDFLSLDGISGETTPNLDNCYLLALNMCTSTDIVSRKVDLATLTHFKESDIIVFSSLLALQYK
uniref:Uncharacterized protein n=1 Tax=Tetranychus urticae TaxID=32264 RepID=A0A158P4E9_TETUR